LGTLLGSSLFAGAVVAPTLFHSETLFGEEVLSNLQEGIIMSSIFQKFNMILNIFLVFMILFEGFLYKNGDRDIFKISILIVLISTSLLFTEYYTPQILEFIANGESGGDIFEKTHLASELDFKILSFSILALLIIRLKKILKA
jgi:hypothetical protein